MFSIISLYISLPKTYFCLKNLAQIPLCSNHSVRKTSGNCNLNLIRKNCKVIGYSKKEKIQYL